MNYNHVCSKCFPFLHVKKRQVQSFCFKTHRELLDSPLQALCVEVGLFGRQLVLPRLKPPGEGARESAELEQLLLTGLDRSEPARGQRRKRMV